MNPLVVMLLTSFDWSSWLGLGGPQSQILWGLTELAQSCVDLVVLLHCHLLSVQVVLFFQKVMITGVFIAHKLFANGVVILERNLHFSHCKYCT